MSIVAITNALTRDLDSHIDSLISIKESLRVGVLNTLLRDINDIAEAGSYMPASITRDRLRVDLIVSQEQWSRIVEYMGLWGLFNTKLAITNKKAAWGASEMSQSTSEWSVPLYWRQGIPSLRVVELTCTYRQE